MDIKITPKKLSGTVNIPSSKSMTHRMLICAALSDGISEISNITFSKLLYGLVDSFWRKAFHAALVQNTAPISSQRKNSGTLIKNA